MRKRRRGEERSLPPATAVLSDFPASYHRIYCVYRSCHLRELPHPAEEEEAKSEFFKLWKRQEEQVYLRITEYQSKLLFLGGILRSIPLMYRRQH